MKTLWVAAGLLACVCQANATVFEPRDFGDEIHRQRYHDLIEELRCLVCQNQSIADSDAELAADLRQIVFEMIVRGESNEAITAYMTERYGSFVLYRPPLTPLTAALWAGPLLFTLLGGTILFVTLKRRHSRSGTGSLSAANRDRAERLVDGGLEPSVAMDGESLDPDSNTAQPSR